MREYLFSGYKVKLIDPSQYLCQPTTVDKVGGDTKHAAIA